MARKWCLLQTCLAKYNGLAFWDCDIRCLQEVHWGVCWKEILKDGWERMILWAASMLIPQAPFPVQGFRLFSQGHAPFAMLTLYDAFHQQILQG